MEMIMQSKRKDIGGKNRSVLLCSIFIFTFIVVGAMFFKDACAGCANKWDVGCTESIGEQFMQKKPTQKNRQQNQQQYHHQYRQQNYDPYQNQNSRTGTRNTGGYIKPGKDGCPPGTHFTGNGLFGQGEGRCSPD